MEHPIKWKRPETLGKKSSHCAEQWLQGKGGDLGGIQTHDLQNRNLTLYSAKLRDHNGCKGNHFFRFTQFFAPFFTEKNSILRLQTPQTAHSIQEYSPSTQEYSLQNPTKQTS